MQDQKQCSFVDGCSQDGARRVMHSILPKKAANTMLIDNHNILRLHQQKPFPSGWNGCIRVDALLQSHHLHPGGRFIRACGQYHASHWISPSNHRFFSFCPSSTLHKHCNVRAICDHTSECVHWVHDCVGIAIQWVILWKSLQRFLLHWALGASEEGEKIWFYSAVRVHAIARIHEISERASETKRCER
jgi:hypothetical protein